MKKILFTLIGVCLTTFLFAQKTVYVDTEYLLNKIPAYKEAQKQLDNLTKQWQSEIEEKNNNISTLYKQYQVDKFLLSNDMKMKREQDILNKEKELKELQKKRFGPDGDRFKKEQELIKPIQDELYNAIKDVSITQGFAFVIDVASSSMSLVYTDPKFDISDTVLKKMGYIK